MATTPEFEMFELYGGKVQIKFFTNSHQYWISIKGTPFKRKGGATTFIGIKDKSKALMSWKGSRIVDFLLKRLAEGKITEELICVASYIDEVEKEEATDIGKEIHAWCEQYIRFSLKQHGYEMPAMPEKKAIQTGVNAFLDWEKEHKVKFLSTERVVYSMKNDYMGTMDIEAKVDGGLCLIDLKSSNGLYNSVNMQTAAYLKADEEESGRKYKGRWVIRLSKLDEVEYIEKEEQKRKTKKVIAKYKGVAYKEYPIAPYQAFEAKKLETDLEEDYEAFLACMTLYKWDAKTDYFKNIDK